MPYLLFPMIDKCMFKKMALSFFLSVLLISCGGEDTTSNSPTDNIQEFDTQTKLQNAIQTSRVICGENNLNCPSNVGKLTFWFKKEEKFFLGSCSGTLVEEEYFVTNSHCIPDDLRVNDLNCSKQISIQFPQTNQHNKENLKCLKIAQVFPYKEWEPDLAVLKIQKSKYLRKNTFFAKNDFSHKQKTYSYTMNPSKRDQMLGTIVRKECQISLDNIFTYHADKYAGNVLISGSACHVISGNSGSGVFNERDELIAVIHIKVENKKLTKIFKDKFINYEPLTNMGFAVNIACLKELAQYAGESCNIIPVGRESGPLDDYLDSKVQEYNMLGIDETNVRAVLQSDLNIKLEKSNVRVYLESLTRMRRNLSDIFSVQKNILHQVFSP
jgi:V8-like Glu-specific endopeptidase